MQTIKHKITIDPDAQDGVHELAKAAATIIAKGLAIMDVTGVFMVIVTDGKGAVHVMTDVEPERVAEFAVYATENIGKPHGTMPTSGSLQ